MKSCVPSKTQHVNTCEICFNKQYFNEVTNWIENNETAESEKKTDTHTEREFI